MSTSSLPSSSQSVNTACQHFPPEAKLAPWQEFFLYLLNELGVLPPEDVSDLTHNTTSALCVNSDTPNFRETWETEPAYVCGRAKKIFKHPDRPEYKFPVLFCGRWDCPTCRKKLVKKWRKHLEAKIREAAASGETFYLVVASEGSWGAVYKEISRGGGLYARFATSPMKVVTTVPVAAMGAVSAPLTADQAIRVVKTLVETVARAGEGSKRITTSRKWKLPSRAKSATKWIEVGRIDADWQKVEAVVKKFHGRLSIENQGTLEEYGKALFDWDLEAEALARHYLDRRHQRFIACLARAG